MNLKKSLILLPIGVICLSSCTSARRYNPEDYHLTVKWRDSLEYFNILHLTDLHMSTLADREIHYNFIKDTVNKARDLMKGSAINKSGIDLIVVTGDIFTFADKLVAKEVFGFFDSLEIPWAVTFGNHDEQCYFSIDWLTGYLNGLNDNKNSYCVFKDLQDDDVFGNANYVINLVQGDIVREQIYMFDSNRYNYGEYAGYDYIHYDQIDWYDRQVDYAKENYAADLKSLAFFHIPFPEFEQKYRIAKEGKDPKVHFVTDATGIYRDKHEDDPEATGEPKINTHLYNHFVRNNSTNGVFIGHNHTSSYVVQDESEGTGNGITLSFGIKSTDRVYSDKDWLGGQVISVKLDGSFDIYSVFNTYNQ